MSSGKSVRPKAKSQVYYSISNETNSSLGMLAPIPHQCHDLGDVSHAADHKPAIAPRNVTSSLPALTSGHFISFDLSKQSTNTIMADNELATRAPESDAQEDLEDVEEAEGISGIQGDSKPDQGAASMGVSTAHGDVI